jgi:hypothetical protein
MDTGGVFRLVYLPPNRPRMVHLGNFRLLGSCLGFLELLILGVGGLGAEDLSVAGRTVCGNLRKEWLCDCRWSS